MARLLVAIALLYLAAAVIGGLVPRNAEWREPEGGVTIFVRDNGVHADLLVPARAAGIDLHRLLPPAHVADPAASRGWLAVGWGQRDVYLATPRWRDLKPHDALRAVLGGAALAHVEHLGPPAPSPSLRSVRLTEAGYRQLIARVAAGLTRDVRGRPIPLLGRGYGRNDVFYAATGRYSAIRTCNQWTADALAAAGVRVGAWTPFSGGLMRWLPRAGAR